ERLREIDETDDLLAGRRAPGAAAMQRVARHQCHRPAVEAREAGDDRFAVLAAHLEEGARIHDGLNDASRVVGLVALARDDGREDLVAAVGRIPVAHLWREFIDGVWQIGEESPRALEGFLLSVGRMIDRACGGLYLPAAEFFARALFSERLDD